MCLLKGKGPYRIFVVAYLNSIDMDRLIAEAKELNKQKDAGSFLWPRLKDKSEGGCE